MAMSFEEDMLTDDIIEDIKLLEGIDELDSSKDNFIKLNIRRAVNIVLIRLNNKDETSYTIKQKYFDAIVDFAKYLMNKKDMGGIKQYTEGGQSVTYSSDSNYIPDSVLSQLPPPRIRVGGR
jgi:hypothetical protein